MELMDISIHAIISLQPPGEDNESVKVGSSGRPPCFLGQNPELYIGIGRLHFPKPPTTQQFGPALLVSMS